MFFDGYGEVCTAIAERLRFVPVALANIFWFDPAVISTQWATRLGIDTARSICLLTLCFGLVAAEQRGLFGAAVMPVSLRGCQAVSAVSARQM